jgi:hypothetical protein
MTSGNTPETATQPGGAASGNTEQVDLVSPTLLPLEYAAALAGYQRTLRSAPLACDLQSFLARNLQW